MIKMKRIRTCISLILTIAILSMSIISVYAETSSYHEQVPENKITDLLKEKMDETSENDLLSVYVWYHDVDQDAIDKLTENEVGYSKEAISQNIKMPSLSALDTLKSESSNSESVLKDYLSDTEKTRAQERILTEQYVTKRREIARKQYYDRAQSIFDNHYIFDDNLAFRSKYAPMFFADLSLEQIKLLAEDELIEEIGWYEEPAVEECTVESAKITTRQDRLENELGLTGNGIKVGMAEVGYPEPDEELDLNSIIKIGNPSDHGHATNTARALVGSESGFSKEITLYSTNYSPTNIETMIDQGVVLINISFGYIFFEDNYTTDYAYSIYDKWIDHIVSQHGVTVVASAGNDAQGSHMFYNGAERIYKRVLSPAMGKNVITVGAFDDRGTSDKSDDRLYHYSSYKNINGTTETIGTEKPDVILPANLLGGGTSTAAPVMTALIAQILQLKPSLVITPQAVKAIVLASCHEKVSPSTNGEAQETMYSGILGREDVVGGYRSGITECQGAGVPNAWVMACIVSQGTYSVGTLHGSGIQIGIEQPQYGAENLNVSLTWLKENYIDDEANHGSNSNVQLGTDACLGLSIYQNNQIIAHSGLKYSTTQMCYSSLSGSNNRYNISISNNYPHKVEYAYAWSTDHMCVPPQINPSSDGIYFIRNVSSNRYLFNDTSANNSYLQTTAKLVSNPNNLTDSYKWIMRASNTGYSLCTGEGYSESYLGISNVTYGNGVYADMLNTDTGLNIVMNDDNTYSIFNSDYSKILSVKTRAIIWEDYNESMSNYDKYKWYFDKVNYLVGDANADGSINTNDPTFVQRVEAYLETPTNIQKYLGDANKDGYCDILDFIAIYTIINSITDN